MSSLSNVCAGTMLAIGLGMAGADGYQFVSQSPESLQKQYRSLAPQDADKLLHNEKYGHAAWVLVGLGVASTGLKGLRREP